MGLALSREPPACAMGSAFTCSCLQKLNLAWQKGLQVHAAHQAILGPEASVWPSAAPAACVMGLALSCRAQLLVQCAGLKQLGLFHASLPASIRPEQAMLRPALCMKLHSHCWDLLLLLLG